MGHPKAVGEVMAVQMDAIRGLAERVAASHHMEVVDVEFVGGGKARTLRVYLEKDAAERAKLKELAAKAAEGGDEGGLPALAELPKGVPVELLSGVTHEDCAEFARDFGTVLDVEDVVPGQEYTLEVSSPGLERKLTRAEEFERFAGSLIKVKTFTPVNNNRLWTGRLTGIANGIVKIELDSKGQRRSAVKQKGKAKKAAAAAAASDEVMEIPLKDVERANLVAEI